MLRRVRIPIQIASLLLFLYLLVRTVGMGENRLGPPVRIFLEIDPLIGITTWLRTGALHGLMFLSLMTIALSVLLGRSFCGWVCPLGTLSQITGRLLRGRRQERSPDRWTPAHGWKFLILLFVLGGAAAGSLWTGILDPISLSIRSLSLGFGPAIEAIVRGAASALAGTPVGGATDPIYNWIRDRLLAPRPPRFEQGMLLATLFVGVLALSWVRRRFWCRILCPLGALVGTVAQGGILVLRQKEALCSGCTACTFHCQGAADPDHMGGWRPSECFVCGNCTASCKQDGLAFGFTFPRFLSFLRHRGSSQTETVAALNPGRRRLLVGLGLGLLAGPVARISPARAHPAGGLIRPPGALPEGEFLDRCVRCGECMKVCPGNGLHPAGLDAGPLALWTPILRPRIGYCEYQCTLCGQVCPTGAIPRLSPAEKRTAVLGLAYVDPGRCLPIAFATPCIVCEEHCPTSPKAIVLEDVSVGGRILRRPHVDPKRCIGCGICEYRCPLDGESAIRVVASGRTGQGSVFDLGGFLSTRS